MSPDVHALMVEGDRIRELQKVFGSYGYEDIRRDRVLLPTDRQELEEALSDPPRGPNLMVKVAWFTKGWTIIWDPHNNMPLRREPCLKLSHELQARVLGIVWEGHDSFNSPSFGFALFDHGRHIRSVEGGRFVGSGCMSGGTWAEGEPVDGEPPNPEEINAQHLEAMVRTATGVSFPELIMANYYVVKELHWEPMEAWDSELEKVRPELEKQLQDLERIVGDSSYSTRIRRGAKDRLRAFVYDVARPEWFRIEAAEALARTPEISHESRDSPA